MFAIWSKNFSNPLPVSITSIHHNTSYMIERVEVESLRLEDYYQILDAMRSAYPNWSGSYWSMKSLEVLLQKFPEGQFVVKVNDNVVGCALSIIVDYDKYGDHHTYKQITGNYTFSTHDPEGDVLYGLEVFVMPEFRGLRLARRLYDARKALCENLNLKAIVFGGRIPEYHKHADTLKPREYIERVRLKEIYDPVLTFQLSNDFHVKKILRQYMPEDAQSKENATLLQWDNIYYQSDDTKSGVLRNVRVGLIQWKMRYFQSKEELYQQAEYFIDSIATYQSDFAVFPEFFNAPLLAPFDHLGEAAAMREVAQYTDEIKSKFSELAISYNVNIITGSMPAMENGHLKNIGFLCHRNGKIDQYEKIHITPDEVKYWGLKGGDKLRVFETDAGKVGVLICYDVEFPELSRLLAIDGMQILFVPYLTDTQNAYMRVRNCAAARAIENECFVAITGSVGNLPEVNNMDIHYSQSMVFTPCDYAFPHNGVKNEATPNTEMILISDLDLRLLKELNTHGSVRNLKDRRLDFYEVRLIHALLDREENGER